MNRTVWIIFWGLLWVLPAGVWAQETVMVDAKKQYQLAQTLFEEKEFSAAAHEYIRFLYLFPDHEKSATAQYQTGVAYFYANRLEDAVRHLERTADRFPDSKVAQDAMFKLSEVYMALDNPGMAVAVLRNLITLTEKGPIHDRACFAMGWLLLDNAHDLKSRSDYPLYPVREAQRYFAMISLEGEKKYHMADTMRSLETIDQLNKKHPAVAGALAVIPGGGFLYCERYRDALVSFLLNASLMLAAYQSFEHDNHFLGGVISFVEAGFYTGNIYGSISSAHKYNQRQQREFVDKLKQDYRGLRDHLSLYPRLIDNGIAVMLGYDF